MDFATVEGTAKYPHLRNIEDYHFRKSIYTANLTLSSLGMGTYLGGIDDKTDEVVKQAVKQSILSGGVNIIDTAINYRFQKAEKSIGKSLKDLFLENLISRDQIFISTKNGYIPGDAEHQLNPKVYLQKLIKDNAVDMTSIVDGSHSMHPSFLETQLQQSLVNLGLKTIDLLYLHNTAEAQLPSLGMKEYLNRVQNAFSFLEQKRTEKKISYYGLATWTCFRVPPTAKSEFLNLQDVIKIAEEIGGTNHGFRFIQLPINLLMNESLTQKWQTVDNQKTSLLEATDELKIGVFGSVPLLQTKLFSNKVPNFSGLSSKPQKLLQFVRSLPHESVIAPLVGQKSPDHVEDNLNILFEPPVPKEFFNSFLPELNVKK